MAIKYYCNFNKVNEISFQRKFNLWFPCLIIFWEQTWKDLERKGFWGEQYSLASSKPSSSCTPTFLLLKTVLFSYQSEGTFQALNTVYCFLTIYLKKQKHPEFQPWRLPALNQTWLTPKIHKAKINQVLKTCAQPMRNSVRCLERHSGEWGSIQTFSWHGKRHSEGGLFHESDWS